jgi:hypothetical protein
MTSSRLRTGSTRLRSAGEVGQPDPGEMPPAPPEPDLPEPAEPSEPIAPDETPTPADPVPGPELPEPAEPGLEPPDGARPPATARLAALARG